MKPSETINHPSCVPIVSHDRGDGGFFWKEVMSFFGVFHSQSLYETFLPLDTIRPSNGILKSSREIDLPATESPGYASYDPTARMIPVVSRDSSSRSAVMAGDMNRDGSSDLLVCNPLPLGRNGLTSYYLFFGSAEEQGELRNVPIGSSIYGESDSDYFGFSNVANVR